MSRWTLVMGLTLFAGCAFRTGASHMSDASVDAGLCGGQVWLTDFSTDPIGSAFQMRNGEPLPGTLAGGVWTENGSVDGTPLDTEPEQNFDTTTYIHVRMRNTTVPPANPGQHGAVCWINVGYAATTFSPVFIDAMLQANGTQLVQLFDKTDAATEQSLFQASVADGSLHDYYLTVVPTMMQATLQIDNGTPVTLAYGSIARNGNDDRWVSLNAWGGTIAEFALERVELCP